MRANPSAPRVLALNLRTALIGYALFEGPKVLLCWGTRSVPSPLVGSDIGKRAPIAELVASFHPQFVVIHLAQPKLKVHARRIAMAAKTVKTEALSHGIPVLHVDDRAIQTALHNFGAATKYLRAAALTGVFSELLWKLPPKRKKWQSEPRAMLVFDAIAAGFAYWQMHDAADS